MLELFVFILINLLGAMSPGPDFAIVAKYAFTGSRRSAYSASGGIASALVVHVFYCLVGVAVFLKGSPHLFRTIQVLGAIYLGYLGLRLILEKKKADGPVAKPRGRNAFLTGFLTNLLNPKATLFLLSLFTQFIDEKTPLWQRAAFGISVPLTAFFWFIFLSYLLTHAAVLPRIKRFQRKFSMAMGLLLFGLSLYVLLEPFMPRGH